MLTFRYQSDNIQQRDTPCSGYLFRKSRERCRLSFCSSLVDTDGLLVEDFRVTVDAEICSVTTRSFNRHMYKYSETLTRELSKRTQFGSVPWPIGSSWVGIRGNEAAVLTSPPSSLYRHFVGDELDLAEIILLSHVRVVSLTFNWLENKLQSHLYTVSATVLIPLFQQYDEPC